MSEESETCGADETANALFTSLTNGYPVPAIFDFTSSTYNYVQDDDLFVPVSDLTIDDLTSGALDGTGAFDALMASVDLHIKREYDQNRITGDQYASAYTAIMQTVLSQSTTFVLNKDQSKWQGVEAQLKARLADIQVNIGKVKHSQERIAGSKLVYDMQTSEAQFAVTKLSIAQTDADTCLIKAKTMTECFTHQKLLPAELAIQHYQRMEVLPSSVNINKVQATRVLPAQATLSEYQNRVLQPLEKQRLEFDLNNILPLKEAIDQYQLDNTLPLQLQMEQYKLDTDMPVATNILKEQYEAAFSQTRDTRSDGITPVVGLLGSQRNLIREQQEVERAKTMDTRVDGFTPIAGSVKKQIDLYDQQIDSFEKDSKYKTAKMYLDGWITQKTLDDALLAPTELQNAEIDAVMATIREANELGTPASP